MKQHTNEKTILAGKLILCFAALGVAVGGEIGWVIAVLPGMATISLIARSNQPRLAPSRIRSRKSR